MPRTPEQYEKIREEKRKQIMDAALELFANEGYHRTSISKIASAAGISKGLIYNYFESKEALVIVIFDAGMKEITSLFDPNKDGILTEDEFDFFVNKFFDALENNGTYWKLYFGIIMQPKVYSMVQERYKETFTEIMQTLVNYYEKQGVKDPMTEAILFGATIDGISMNYLLSPDMFPLDEMKEAIIEKFGHKSVGSRQ
jgi:AcrR family transcriptional regulator